MFYVFLFLKSCCLLTSLISYLLFSEQEKENKYPQIDAEPVLQVTFSSQFFAKQQKEILWLLVTENHKSCPTTFFCWFLNCPPQCPLHNCQFQKRKFFIKRRRERDLKKQNKKQNKILCHRF